MSKWSSIAALPRPVTSTISSIPAATASSTTSWIVGTSTMGSISFGMAWVGGGKGLRGRAAGMTALRTRMARHGITGWAMARKNEALFKPFLFADQELDALVADLAPRAGALAEAKSKLDAGDP